MWRGTGLGAGRSRLPCAPVAYDTALASGFNGGLLPAELLPFLRVHELVKNKSDDDALPKTVGTGTQGRVALSTAPAGLRMVVKARCER